MSISFKELNGEIMNMRRELLKAKLVIASFAARIEALEQAQPRRIGYSQTEAPIVDSVTTVTDASTSVQHT